MSANHEEKKEPYAKSFSQEITLTPSWKEYSLPFRTVQAYGANGSQVTFHCGFAPGIVEIADIRLLRATP